MTVSRIRGSAREFPLVCTRESNAREKQRAKYLWRQEGYETTREREGEKARREN